MPRVHLCGGGGVVASDCETRAEPGGKSGFRVVLNELVRLPARIGESLGWPAQLAASRWKVIRHEGI